MDLILSRGRGSLCHPSQTGFGSANSQLGLLPVFQQNLAFGGWIGYCYRQEVEISPSMEVTEFGTAEPTRSIFL